MFSPTPAHPTDQRDTPNQGPHVDPATDLINRIEGAVNKAVTPLAGVVAGLSGEIFTDKAKMPEIYLNPQQWSTFFACPHFVSQLPDSIDSYFRSKLTGRSLYELDRWMPALRSNIRILQMGVKLQRENPALCPVLESILKEAFGGCEKVLNNYQFLVILEEDGAQCANVFQTALNDQLIFTGATAKAMERVRGFREERGQVRGGREHRQDRTRPFKGKGNNTKGTPPNQ